MKKYIIIIGVFLTISPGFSQGFSNLNFESAHFTVDPSSPYYPYSVYASNAIPGWTPYINGTPVSEIWSNDVSLGGAAISIQGTNSGYPPIQGNYFIFLQGGYGSYGSAAIGQTGTIPDDALSLIFWGSDSYIYGGDGMVITFDGQQLNFSAIGSTGNYTIYGTDISAFAGRTGELLFTALDGDQLYVPPGGLPYGGGGFIDNIQFSSMAVPEPGELALAALGAALFSFSGRRIFLRRLENQPRPAEQE